MRGTARVGWRLAKFQWAPTLGGECYCMADALNRVDFSVKFQWAPTLGGECYEKLPCTIAVGIPRFNGHPPLGVNATICISRS